MPHTLTNFDFALLDNDDFKEDFVREFIIAAISGSFADAFLSISDIFIRFSKSLLIVLSLNLTKWIF